MAVSAVGTINSSFGLGPFQQALCPLLATSVIADMEGSEGHYCPLALVILADERIQYNTS